MSYRNPKDAWKNELWNVSLLPTVKVSQGIEPQGPGPAGGNALSTPALLSTREAAPVEPQPEPLAA
jgi:hypothetical protein